jgi:hypothetical protein
MAHTDRMTIRFAIALIVTLALRCASPLQAEQADLALESLEAQATVIVVGACTRVEEKRAVSNGQTEETTWFHHITVERVERAPDASISVGDRVIFLSQTRRWVGEGLPPPSGSGHRGLPAVGERRRIYATGDAAKREGGAAWLSVLAPNGWRPVARSVTLVGADDEYRSEITMPLLADLLTRDAGISATVAFPTDPKVGRVDPDQRSHIAHIETLDRAEVAVFYMRWREPDAPTLTALTRYFGSGRPIVGLRTSTHMLRPTEGGAPQAADVEWPTRIFGTRWISHHGHESRTRLLPPEGAAREHPILRGVRGGETVRSWLYDVEPLGPGCVPLLWGESIDRDGKPGARQPVVWVRERSAETPTPFPTGGTPARRMAFTTLGHPADFESREVRRLVEQMVLWAVGDESQIPAEGVAAEPSKPFSPPPTR